MATRIRRALLSLGLGVLLVVALAALAAGIAQATNSTELPAALPRVALVHLAPFASGAESAVTVKVDSIPVIAGIEYGESSAGYLPVPEGSHLVQVYAGGNPTPAISSIIVVTADMDFTAVLVGDGTNQPLDIQLMQDDNAAPPDSYVKVRIGHLAPFSNTIPGTLFDVRLQDGTLLMANVPYGAVTPTYLPLPAGSYDFKITAPGGSPTWIDPLAVTLNSGSILSLLAAGDRLHQPLGVFALPSGEKGYFLPLHRHIVYLPVTLRNLP
jgi:Domain of unknown function (DUF4397)